MPHTIGDSPHFFDATKPPRKFEGRRARIAIGGIIESGSGLEYAIMQTILTNTAPDKAFTASPNREDERILL